MTTNIIISDAYNPPFYPLSSTTHPQACLICCCTAAVGLAWSSSVLTSTSSNASCSRRSENRSPHIAIPMQAVKIPGGVDRLYSPIPHMVLRFVRVCSSIDSRAAFLPAPTRGISGSKMDRRMSARR